MPANTIPAAKMPVSSEAAPVSQTAAARAEWIQRVRQIALYFLLIGATIALSTILANRIHR